MVHARLAFGFIAFGSGCVAQEHQRESAGPSAPVTRWKGSRAQQILSKQQYADWFKGEL